MDTVEIWSAIGAVASAVAAIATVVIAVLAYQVSIKAADSTKDAAASTRDAAASAQSSADSTEALTRIEARRDWADRIPQFKATLLEVSDTYAQLQIELIGPPMLDRLDKVEMKVRDDFYDRKGSGLGGAPTDEEVAHHVWGPFRFIRGTDGGSESGRTVDSFMLPLGEARKFAMDRQSPPLWNTSGTAASWARDYEGQPVRLMLKCFREDFDSWSVPIEVMPAKPPKK